MGQALVTSVVVSDDTGVLDVQKEFVTADSLSDTSFVLCSGIDSREDSTLDNKVIDSVARDLSLCLRDQVRDRESERGRFFTFSDPVQSTDGDFVIIG